jgi:UDPglucose 6-dehydrogenase
LLARGAAVSAYDPVAMHEARKIFSGDPAVRFVEDPVDALDGAEALLIVTEWKEFRSPDFAELKKRLKQPVIIDGRNLYDPAAVRELGIEYLSVGRP